MNILEFIEEMIDQGYSEEVAARIWNMENNPEYDPADYEIKTV